MGKKETGNSTGEDRNEGGKKDMGLSIWQAEEAC